jgi:hypothetical protein
MNCSDEDIGNFYLNKSPIPFFNDQKILDLFSGHKI